MPVFPALKAPKEFTASVEGRDCRALAAALQRTVRSVHHAAHHSIDQAASKKRNATRASVKPDGQELIVNDSFPAGNREHRISGLGRLRCEAAGTRLIELPFEKTGI
jgi:hypothetical protein